MALIVLTIILLSFDLVSIYGKETQPFVLKAPSSSPWPLVINTWEFINATKKAWEVLSSEENGSCLDAVEQGCTVCEQEQCDGTVGFGGSPDENGETTLDAVIMDGLTHDVGGVAGLRRVKNAISVARMVLERTSHSLLVGDQATEFALMMGFKEENLTTSSSAAMYKEWKDGSCQPNFWKNVLPDPTTSCGPYQPLKFEKEKQKWILKKEKKFGVHNHDTIGMLAVDINGNIAGGTSTNGARHKIPGRVGDSPIPGSGVYVDRLVGGAVATGDGDVMMRFMPALVAVEKMRMGLPPRLAAEEAITHIVTYYPNFMGALVALNLEGSFSAACYGFDSFPYSVANVDLNNVTVFSIPCLS